MGNVEFFFKESCSMLSFALVEKQIDRAIVKDYLT